jgi:phage head maturation protease
MTKSQSELAALVAGGRATLKQMEELGADTVAAIKTNPEVLQVRIKAEEPIAINEEQRKISYVVSDETPDRVGDIIAVKGWDLSNYKKNPVILWAHEAKDVPPIGRGHNVRRRYGPDRLTADVEFAPKEAYEFADTIYQLARRGFIRATSVGFMPKEAAQLDKEQRSKLGLGPYGQLFTSSELMEISIVAVPANPSALEEGVKSLCSEGLLDRMHVQKFLDRYPADDEQALIKVRKALRSFVDFGAAMTKSPACRQEGESQDDCVSRKTPELIEEGMEQDQAVAVANSVCEDACGEEKEAPIQTKDVSKLREAMSALKTAADMIGEAIEMYSGDGDEEYESSPDTGSEERGLQAMAYLVEQQAEQTKATRQLVDALTDLTVKLREDKSSGDDGGCDCAKPEAKSPDASQIEAKDIEGILDSVSRGFADRVRRELSTKPTTN